MSRLDVAMERFSAALDALEARLARKLEEVRAEAAAPDAGSLREERDRLAARIAELEEEARALAGLTEEVEERLDGAIADIRTALQR